MAISYEVTTIGKSGPAFLGINFLRISARAALSPWYMILARDGVNLKSSVVALESQWYGQWTNTLDGYLEISFTQFERVDRGAIIKYGPCMPFPFRWARNPIVWMVFPRPIWSASIPFSPFCHNDISHLTPFIWYDFNFPPVNNGTRLACSFSHLSSSERVQSSARRSSRDLVSMAATAVLAFFCIVI